MVGVGKCPDSEIRCGVCHSNLLFLNQCKDSEIIQIPSLDDEKNMWYFEKYLSAAL